MEGEFSEKQVKVLKDVIWQSITDAVRDMRDLLMQEIRASEKRVKAELASKFGVDIKASEERTIGAVGQMLDVSVVPQLDDHEVRIAKLEEKAAI